MARLPSPRGLCRTHLSLPALWEAWAANIGCFAYTASSNT